jgi:hypothetical protein
MITAAANNILEKYGDPQTGCAQVHAFLKGIAVKHIALILQISTNLEVREDLNKATIWFKQVYNTYIKGAGNDKEPGQRRQGRMDL